MFGTVSDVPQAGQGMESPDCSASANNGRSQLLHSNSICIVLHDLACEFVTIPVEELLDLQNTNV